MKTGDVDPKVADDSGPVGSGIVCLDWNAVRDLLASHPAVRAVVGGDFTLRQWGEDRGGEVEWLGVELTVRCLRQG